METYKATNTLNGKFYIGSTNNFSRRKIEHLRSTKNLPFQNALRKNPGVFEWEVWGDDSQDPILEQALLDMWFGTEQCYNLNPNASKPPNCVATRKANGMKALVEKTGIFSLSREEAVLNGKKAHLDHPGLASRSGRASGKKAAEEKTGIHSQSPEERKRLSVEGGKAAAEKFSLGVTCKETGAVYSSAREAERATGVHNSAIGACCRGVRKTAGGYHWGFT